MEPAIERMQLLHLPDELILRILGFVHIDTRIQIISTVNRRLCRLASEPNKSLIVPRCWNTARLSHILSTSGVFRRLRALEVSDVIDLHDLLHSLRGSPLHTLHRLTLHADRLGDGIRQTKDFLCTFPSLQCLQIIGLIFGVGKVDLHIDSLFDLLERYSRVRLVATLQLSRFKLIRALPILLSSQDTIHLKHFFPSIGVVCIFPMVYLPLELIENIANIDDYSNEILKISTQVAFTCSAYNFCKSLFHFENAVRITYIPQNEEKEHVGIDNVLAKGKVICTSNSSIRTLEVHAFQKHNASDTQAGVLKILRLENFQNLSSVNLEHVVLSTELLHAFQPEVQILTFCYCGYSDDSLDFRISNSSLEKLKSITLKHCTHPGRVLSILTPRLTRPSSIADVSIVEFEDSVAINQALEKLITVSPNLRSLRLDDIEREYSLTCVNVPMKVFPVTIRTFALTFNSCDITVVTKILQNVTLLEDLFLDLKQLFLIYDGRFLTCSQSVATVAVVKQAVYQLLDTISTLSFLHEFSVDSSLLPLEQLATRLNPSVIAPCRHMLTYHFPQKIVRQLHATHAEIHTNTGDT